MLCQFPKATKVAACSHRHNSAGRCGQLLRRRQDGKVPKDTDGQKLPKDPAGRDATFQDCFLEIKGDSGARFLRGVRRDFLCLSANVQELLSKAGWVIMM